MIKEAEDKLIAQSTHYTYDTYEKEHSSQNYNYNNKTKHHLLKNSRNSEL